MSTYRMYATWVSPNKIVFKIARRFKQMLLHEKNELYKSLMTTRSAALDILMMWCFDGQGTWTISSCHHKIWVNFALYSFQTPNWTLQVGLLPLIWVLVMFVLLYCKSNFQGSIGSLPWQGPHIPSKLQLQCLVMSCWHAKVVACNILFLPALGLVFWNKKSLHMPHVVNSSEKLIFQ